MIKYTLNVYNVISKKKLKWSPILGFGKILDIHTCLHTLRFLCAKSLRFLLGQAVE